MNQEISPQEIIGIGLSNQCGGLVCIDEEERPLYRVITYVDCRTEIEKDLLKKILAHKLQKISVDRHAPNCLASSERYATCKFDFMRISRLQTYWSSYI
ncbi:FGGY family carbohydrate kinase [Candidatus Bathyarchaeota archaeon]|nr:FGGY family carbohydrate kinase [Candidatus Bathyarchaeota archaeon]